MTTTMNFRGKYLYIDAGEFDGIEIKVKHGFSKTVIPLFSLVPQGKSFFENKRIRDLP